MTRRGLCMLVSGLLSKKEPKELVRVSDVRARYGWTAAFAATKSLDLIEKSTRCTICPIPVVLGTKVVDSQGQEIPLCYRAEEYSDGTLVCYCYKPGKGGRPYYDRKTGDVARCVWRGKGRLIYPKSLDDLPRVGVPA